MPNKKFREICTSRPRVELIWRLLAELEGSEYNSTPCRILLRLSLGTLFSFFADTTICVGDRSIILLKKSVFLLVKPIVHMPVGDCTHRFCFDCTILTNGPRRRTSARAARRGRFQTINRVVALPSIEAGGSRRGKRKRECRGSPRRVRQLADRRGP